jgi:simple sugar transport system ATP-binding protein
MVGRPVVLALNKKHPAPGRSLLAIKDLTVTDNRGVELVKNINLEVRAGEIVAVAGVQGNGQTELARAILNLEPHCRGEIQIDGENILSRSVSDAIHSGVAFVPESRELDGLISSFSISENLILDVFDKEPYGKKLVMFPNVVNSEAEKRIQEFDIRTQSVSDPVSSLSGGNKQKVVLARELSRPVKVVVASQPTRGLDVGSIEFVHERMIAERDAGRGVLLISTELDEVFALADRIAVMYKGEVIDIVPATISRSELGLLMAGVKQVKA